MPSAGRRGQRPGTRTTVPARPPRQEPLDEDAVGRLDDQLPVEHFGVDEVELCRSDEDCAGFDHCTPSADDSFFAGTAAYCVGNLGIPDDPMPWEDPLFGYPPNMATPLAIEIEASNGASDYGNKFGEPVIQGFTRSAGLRLPGGERREWIKPIMFSGGIGQIDARHTEKEKPEPEMWVVKIGGPAYRIGMGGGAASSMVQGENIEALDFNAVQRGDAEMEQKLNRVIRACIELGERNPIVSIHDQGAGGPANVLKELVEKSGGRVEIRNIRVGDPTTAISPSAAPTASAPISPMKICAG